MRASPKVVGVGLTLAVIVSSFSPTTAAEPKDEVAAATTAWAQALGEDDPEKVLPLYSSDAVIWGTISPKLRSDPAALRDYFVAAFKALPGLKVTFGDQLIRCMATRQLIPAITRFHMSKTVRAKSSQHATASPTSKMVTAG
jgi:hypothetical protein